MSKSRAERRRESRQEPVPAPTAPTANRTPLWTAALVLLGGVAIGGAVALELGEKDEPATPARVTVPTPIQTTPTAAGTTKFVPQPPGEAPAGKVWSPTCGHWHDAVTGQHTP